MSNRLDTIKESAFNNWIFILLLLVLYCINFSDALNLKTFYGPFQDNVFWLHPELSYISQVMTEGELPLYDENSSYPLYQFPFLSIFYPLNFTFLDIYGSPEAAMATTHVIKLFHLLFMLFGVFFLLRSLKFSSAASILGASIYTFSTFITFVVVWQQNFFSMVWGIYATAAFISVINGKDIRKHTLIFIGTFTLMMLARPSGGIKFYIYVWLILFLFSFWNGNQNVRNKTFFQYTGITLFLCVALNLHTVIGFITHASEYIRWLLINGEITHIIGATKVPFASVTELQAEFGDVINFIFPISLEPRYSYYLGIIPFFFAALALSDKAFWKNPNLLAFFVIFLWTFLSLFGEHTGASYLNYHLPGLNAFRHLWMFSYLLFLAIAVFVAYGFDLFTQDNSSAQVKISFGIVLLLGLGKLYFGIVNETEFIIMMSYIGFAFLGILGVFILRSFRFQKSGIFCLALAGMFAILYSLDQSQHPSHPPEKVSSSTHHNKKAVIAHEIYSRLNEIERSSDIKYRAISNLKDYGIMSSYLFDGLIQYYPNLRGIRAYSSPMPYDIFWQYSQMWLYTGYYELHGVKYFISDKEKYRTDSSYEELFTVEGISVYTANDVREDIFLAENVDGFFHTDRNRYVPGIARKLADARMKTLVERREYQRVKDFFEHEKTAEKGSNTLTRRDIQRNTKTVDVHNIDPVLLILNENYSRDWKVNVNGTSRETLRVNLNQVGVLLSPGDHRVTFDFAPTSFMISLYLFFFATLAYLGMVVAYFRSKNTNRKSESSSLQ